MKLDIKFIIDEWCDHYYLCKVSDEFKELWESVSYSPDYPIEDYLYHLYTHVTGVEFKTLHVMRFRREFFNYFTEHKREYDTLDAKGLEKMIYEYFINNRSVYYFMRNIYDDNY